MSDPYRVLGVSATADDETIRAAYLALIREYPPERDRKRFECARTAFEAISSARGRLAHALFDKTIPTPEDVLAAVEAVFQPRLVDERHLRRVLGVK